jgi:hypothetical protein
MKNIKELIENVDVKSKKSISEAANAILEDSNIKPGATVAVIDDPTYSRAGVKGKVKSVEGGYATLELANGESEPYQVSLLIAL